MNNLKGQSLLWSILFAMSLLLGCAEPSDNSVNNDPILKSYMLIDAGRTDEAILLLESTYASDPSYEVKAALASAYAHKAGVKIQALIPVVSKIEAINQYSYRMNDPEKAKEVSEKVDIMAMNFAKLLGKFNAFFQAYSAIPALKYEDSIHINTALDLLEDLDDIRPEDSLYKATLSVLKLKYLLSTNIIGELSPIKTQELEQCKLNLNSINEGVVEGGKLLIDIYTDLANALPSESQRLSTLSNEAAQVTSDLTIFVTSLNLLDDIQATFIKQTSIDNGFSNLITCGPN